MDHIRSDSYRPCSITNGFIHVFLATTKHKLIYLLQNDGQQSFCSFANSNRCWLQLFLLLQLIRFARFANAFRSRNAQLHHLQHSGQAVFVLQQIRVLHQPGRAALESGHNCAVQIFAVCLRWSLTLVEDVVANPFHRSLAFKSV